MLVYATKIFSVILHKLSSESTYIFCVNKLEDGSIIKYVSSVNTYS